MPQEVENLLEIARIKEICNQKGIIKITQRNNNIIVTFANNESFDMPIDELIKKYGDRIKFSPGKEPYITYKLEDQSDILEEIKNFLKI